MPHNEIPLHRVRGKALPIRARARLNGRSVSLVGHYLRCAIADRDTYDRITTVESGAGITQDEDGFFEVIFPASRTRQTVLPESEYWYEVEIWEDGDSEKRYTLQQGPLFLEGSPFE